MDLILLILVSSCLIGNQVCALNQAGRIINSNPSCGETHPVCSVEDSNLPRVAYGERACPGQFPYLVSLQVAGNHSCGGVIIDDRHILTDGHCYNPLVINETFVSLGDFSLNEFDCELKMEIENVFTDYDALIKCGDIALIRTREQIKFKLTENGFGSINRVCMPSNETYYDKEEDQLIISGWGSTEYDEEPTIPLWAMMVFDETNQSCSKCDDIFFLKGINGYSSGCSGDSGSPIVREINGSHELVGLHVTRTGNAPCDDVVTSEITSVLYYLDWIKQHL